MSSVALVWLQRDLRLADNPALHEASEKHAQVLPVYIHAPEEDGAWSAGGASNSWLHHSLAALQKDLASRGGVLAIRRGPSLPALRALIRETGAGAVYWNRLYEPAALARAKTIKEALRADGLNAESFSAGLLFEPWQIKTLGGEPYRVFTPFYRAMLPRLPARAPLSAPRRLTAPACASLALEDLQLVPRIPWDQGFYPHWQPGEQGARQRLEAFCDEAIAQYQEARDRPAAAGTSRLSPHLHFGEISPVQVHARCQRLMAENPKAGVLKNAEGFIRELVWREFAHHLLFHYPHTAEQPMHEKFAAFPWRKSYGKDLQRWQRGQTGIPIVDAGLRELWHTGYMHNRVRMIVASFLTKNLLIPWQEGARWFWDTLVDADLANNSLGWQWTAGCGADAAPYFRVFNPVLQSRKFDAEGVYLRQWLPELQSLDNQSIHAPWEAPAAPENYPAPLVDLAESRQRALEAYQKLKAM